MLVSWIAVDWAVALYATFVAVLAVVCAPAIPQWPYLLVAHAALVSAMAWLPARGAPWESARPEPLWLARTRAVARFLRYTYPALLLTPFFEEVGLTVNGVWPHTPYWFEQHLFVADRALFGATPAVLLAHVGGPVLDEMMHAFYFAYFPIIIGGIVLAWNGLRRDGGTPAPGFHLAMTCMMLGFFLSYVWYPFVPARGPWEHPDVMAGLRPFDGWIFTRAINVIMAGAAVSGGCFPSAHVSGAWALVFGLYAHHPRRASRIGLIAAGLTVACVYTRYHHAIDVAAGFLVAVLAALIGHRLARRARHA